MGLARNGALPAFRCPVPYPCGSARQQTYKAKKTMNTKKIVCGTQRALDKEVEAHKAKGWELTTIVLHPRPKNKFIYIANLKKTVTTC